ncbi:MAG: ETX/MTX2 family pore-forming toxin [Candidatus Korobacteraceae bacterium]
MPTSTITKLPAPSTPPPTLPTGTVVLYRDNNWQDQSPLKLTTANNREAVRHTIGGTNMQDAATWVAFNLPVGQVMTLTDNDNAVPTVSSSSSSSSSSSAPAPGSSSVPDTSSFVWNLRGCGRAIDLVGTGQTEGVDLTQVNMNDCVSSFFWRNVDLSLGAIELYDDSNFKGNRNVIFLGEWPSGQVNSITGWWLEDRVSSVRWTTLDDRQTASLFENNDGSGRSYQNIQGSGDTKEISDLNQAQFNDCMSSFRWDGLAPVKEIIAPFNLSVPIDTSNATGLSANTKGTNDSDLPQPVTVTLTDTDSQTLTVTVTDTIVAGFELSYSQSWNAGVSSGTLSVKLNFSYTHTNTTQTSETRTVALAISQTVNAPPHTTYVATLTVQLGKLPPTTYKTKAQRWYTQPVTGAVPDPANNNWYLRTEEVNGTVEGGLACNTLVNINAQPIGGTTAPGDGGQGTQPQSPPAGQAPPAHGHKKHKHKP